MGYREGHRGTGEVPPAEAGTHLQLLSPIRTLPCRSTERGGGAQVPAHAASERSRCPPPPPYASRGGACQPQVPCLQDPDSCCAQLPLAQVQMPRVARQLEEGRKGVFQDVLRASA